MTPAQLSAAIDTAQQQQSTTGKFGSWHQDSAARCLDLVASVIEPEIAERVAGYQPIATVPDDGTVVMFDGPKMRYPHIGRGDDYGNGAHWLADATHWRTLPRGPATDQRAGE